MTERIEVACKPCGGTGRAKEWGPSIEHTFADGTVIATADLVFKERKCSDCSGTGKVSKPVT